MEKTIEQANAELQDVWEDVPQNDGTWKPTEEGETLIGEYIGFEQTSTGKNLYLVIDDKMEKVKVWGGKIIDSFFGHKKGVAMGERVKFTYLGKVAITNPDGSAKINAETKEPMYYNNFKVQHSLSQHKNTQLSSEDQAKIDAADAAGIKQAEAEMKAEKEEIDPKNIPF